jgi:transcription initiation factor TFIIE subunit alpha
MRLSDKAIEQLVKEVAGSDVLPLIELIKNKENVSEFKLAEKLNLTINQIRNMLYRLYNHNIVYFTRKKDKKKGWYVYFWNFNTKEAKNVLNRIRQNRLEQLKANLKEEESRDFFVCPAKDVRLRFENAMEYEFKCPECGKVLEQEDNSRRVEAIKRQIRELEEGIEEEKLFEERVLTREAKKAAKKAAKEATIIKRKKVVKKKASKKAAKKRVKKRAK